MFKKCFLLINLILLTSCAGMFHKVSIEDAHDIGKSWVGQDANKLLQAYPDLKSQEVSNQVYQYTVEFRTQATFAESMFTSTYQVQNRGGYAFIAIHFIVENNIVKSYNLTRRSANTAVFGDQRIESK